MERSIGPILDPAILSYYNRRAEETRLERGLSQLEAVRTRELLVRHLPPAPASVLDIGGAAGAYAGWLAEQGYTVHLIDAVPRLVDEARRREFARPLASIAVGDARQLEMEDDCVDVVLLLGPLYHLTSAADRAAALAEAIRVLRRGGMLFAVAISRWASALDALVRDAFAEPDVAAAVERAVRDGQHRNPSARDGLFTTAYFHRPEEFSGDVAAAGFEVVGLYGIDGPAPDAGGLRRTLGGSTAPRGYAASRRTRRVRASVARLERPSAGGRPEATRHLACGMTNAAPDKR